MQWRGILSVLGWCLLVLSISMLPPLWVAYVYQDGHYATFISTMLLTGVSGAAFALWGHGATSALKVTDGFIVVVVVWCVLSIFSALPFVWHPQVTLPWLDAVFEAVSGLTTTGASIIPSVDALPYSISYYRQQLHFIGGMGILLLAVAILPTFGIGGLQVHQAEIPGPVKDTKLTPRVKETAKSLWGIYLLFNLICAVGYHLAGMSWLEAVGESFSTIATGGFAMHDDSFAHYPNAWAKGLAMLFMVLSSLSYTLHYWVLRKRQLSVYMLNEESRWFLGWLLLITALIVAWLAHIGGAAHAIDVGFTVVSLATTTGFMTDYFPDWSPVALVLLMATATVGGCAGSTCGGLKVLRCLLVKKQIQSELHRIIHPRAMVPVKFTGMHFDGGVLQSMWAFLAAFLFILWLLTCLFMVGGLDFSGAVGTSVAMLANMGAGIGEIAAHYGELSAMNKALSVVAMVAGRLEIFTLWVVLSPAFWRA